jgi:peptide-methionine (S)-S-oxide reductase
MEDLFSKEDWVVDTEVWYLWWINDNPTYAYHPGHAEGIEITYDVETTSFLDILDFFFTIHNPTTLDQQWNDRGSSYRSAIFIQNEEEKKIAIDIIRIVNASRKRWADVVTSLETFTTFWPAEEHHQDYLVHNPGGYTCHSIRFWSFLAAE